MIFLVIQTIENDTDRDRVFSLYTEHYALLKYKARQIVHEPEAADDMVQDAILSIINRIHLLRELSEQQLLAYAVHTVEHRSIDFVRRQGKIQHISFEETEAYATEGAEFLDEVLDKLEEKDIMIKLGIALRKLPERDRSVLIYKYFYQYSDYHISQILGVKKESVRMALTRARNKVKGILDTLLMGDACDVKQQSTTAKDR